MARRKLSKSLSPAKCSQWLLTVLHLWWCQSHSSYFQIYTYILGQRNESHRSTTSISVILVPPVCFLYSHTIFSVKSDHYLTAAQRIELLHCHLSAGGAVALGSFDTSSCALYYLNKNILCHRILALQYGTVWDRTHRLICNQGCEIAYSVWQCMSEETLNGIKIM